MRRIRNSGVKWLKTLPEEFAKDADRLVSGLCVPALWIKPYLLNEPSSDLESVPILVGN